MKVTSTASPRYWSRLTWRPSESWRASGGAGLVGTAATPAYFPLDAVDWPAEAPVSLIAPLPQPAINSVIAATAKTEHPARRGFPYRCPAQLRLMGPLIGSGSEVLRGLGAAGNGPAPSVIPPGRGCGGLRQAKWVGRDRAGPHARSRPCRPGRRGLRAQPHRGGGPLRGTTSKPAPAETSF